MGYNRQKRVKKDGRKPKELWHDLLTEFTDEHGDEDFFGGKKPNIVGLLSVWLYEIDITVPSILSVTRP